MRPYIPPAIFPAATGADGGALLHRAEESGRVKGRLEGAAEGHARGLADGEAAARAALDGQIAELEAALAHAVAENAFADTMRALLARRGEDRQAADAECRAAVAAALRLVFPVLLGQAEGREVAALLQQTLLDRPADTLHVRAHPDTLDRVCDAMPADALDRMRLTRDAACARGAADISWQLGGVSYDPHALLAGITGALLPATNDFARAPSCENLEQETTP